MKRKYKNRPKVKSPDLTALAQRAVGLDNPEIMNALDVSISNLGRYISEFRQDQGPRANDYLAEADLAAVAVSVLLNELIARREGRPEVRQPVRQTSNRPY
jgi:hypothetical protein